MTGQIIIIDDSRALDQKITGEFEGYFFKANVQDSSSPRAGYEGGRVIILETKMNVEDSPVDYYYNMGKHDGYGDAYEYVPRLVKILNTLPDSSVTLAPGPYDAEAPRMMWGDQVMRVLKENSSGPPPLTLFVWTKGHYWMTAIANDKGNALALLVTQAPDRAEQIINLYREGKLDQYPILGANVAHVPEVIHE